MSVLLIDYEYLSSKNISLIDPVITFPKEEHSIKGICIIIQPQIYNKLNEMIYVDRLPYLSSSEFQKSIINIIPFLCNKHKKTIIFQCSNTFIHFTNDILTQVYQNFPHNYQIILEIDLTNDNFGIWSKEVSKYFSFPVLDGVSKIVKFYKENDLKNSLSGTDTLHLLQKVLEDYEQMIDDKESILQCQIQVKLDNETIQELSKLNSKIFETGDKFSGLEVSDKFMIKDISKTGDNETLVTLNMNKSNSSKLGDNDSVDVVYSKYTYHTHPKKTYDKFEVELAWPSADDFISFILLFIQNVTIFHITCTLEGAYITTVNPNFMQYLYDFSDDDYTELCEKFYNIKYPSRNDKFNTENVPLNVDKFLEVMKRKIEWKGKSYPPIFKMDFVKWKDFTDKKIFRISFYSDENKSCQIVDNIK